MTPSFKQELLRPLRMCEPTRDRSELLAGVPSKQWSEILEWLHQSGLALYWWSLVRNLPAGHLVPATLCHQLDYSLTENKLRLIEMNGEFRDLVRIMECTGEPYAVLKGFSLTPDFCPDPSLRTQYDFDFLVPAESVELVDHSLRRAGFVQKPARNSHEPRVFFHSLKRPNPPQSMDSVYSRSMFRIVEIHTSLWEPRDEQICFQIPGEVLSRSILRQWNGISFFTLPPEEILLHQVLHIFRHILNNKCRLSHLYELACFLRLHDETSPVWPALQAVIQGDVRLLEVAGIAFSLTESIFGAQVCRQARSFSITRLSPPSAFWVRRHGINSALSNFSTSKSSLYLHGLFVDTREEWREVRNRRLFPLRKLVSSARGPALTPSEHKSSLHRELGPKLRRCWFHGLSALKYFWGLPEWNRCRARQPGELKQNCASIARLATGTRKGD